MATIALYAGKINQMPSLISDVRKSVDAYSSELFSMKSKALNIRRSVCDLDDVLGMVQASTQLQERKSESLDAFCRKTEEFAADVVRTDEDAAALINQSKEDFYNKYNYLKPDAEKSGWEEFWDDAAEWCKEHWKEILIGFSFIVIGAVLSWITGGSFLLMLSAGLKSAIISGIVSGGINAGVTLFLAISQGEDITTIINDSLNAFGEGAASGFMLGGIMAGISMARRSGCRIAAKVGAKTGKKGGLGREGGFKILSPDRIAADGNSGGTLFKIGKTFRVDVDTRTLALPNFLHMHLPKVTGSISWLGIKNGHIPIGLYFSALFGSSLSIKEAHEIDQK